MFRILIFLITNLAVVVIFGIILTIFGIQSQSIYGLMILSSLLGFGGAFISLIMSKWIALHSVNGKIINIPTNPTEEWLLKTIQNQSNNIGIKTPEIAIYDSNDINAFATGAQKNSSLIAVSTGLLNNMSSSEAEAVLAHEITHISNGDMITLTLIQGVLNTFVIFLSRIFAQIISNFMGTDKEENNKTYINSSTYFILSTCLDIMFGILANIIVLWFSRQREFYADEGSAKLVGREKMISALERLKTNYERNELGQHMTVFGINNKAKSIFYLFMSHPPLNDRIEALYSHKYDY